LGCEDRAVQLGKTGVRVGGDSGGRESGREGCGYSDGGTLIPSTQSARSFALSLFSAPEKMPQSSPRHGSTASCEFEIGPHPSICRAFDR
jgi:hypothetical protein